MTGSAPARAGTLLAALLDTHRDSTRDAAAPLCRVRPDHVVLGERDGAFALWAFRDPVAGGSQVPLALLALDARGVRGGAEEPRAAALARAARESGLHVARAGSGRAAHVYAERFAAPGRVALGCAPGLAMAGALGTLALPVDRLEAAAALAGVPHALHEPPVAAVRLAGAPGLGVSGHDIAIEIGRRARYAPGSVIEISGASRLAMRDRFAVAAAAPTLRAAAVLFGSDDLTHAYLRAQGRDADWKRWGVDAAPDADEFTLELETVEPWLVRFGEPDAVRAVRHAAGSAVRRVVIGAGATYGDWAVLAAALRGRTLDPAVTCVVVAGSRRIVETAHATGVWQDLAAAGVRFAADGHEPAGGLRAEGVTLAFAVDDERCDWRASLESCAAAALTGVVTDPRALASADAATEPAPEPVTYAADPLSLLAPEAAAAPAPPVTRAPFTRRGVVLLEAGDDVRADQVVPWGPRAAAAAPDALTALVFRPLAPGFAAHARAAGGGWLLAGRGFLGGARADLAAWLLARLGITVVIATSYAPGAAQALVHSGVLPLVRPLRESGGFRAGDELELPSGLDDLEPGRPVTVRDLTRGDQSLLAHELDGYELARVRAGGLMSRERRAA